jgi:hypothetical protein
MVRDLTGGPGPFSNWYCVDYRKRTSPPHSVLLAMLTNADTPVPLPTVLPQPPPLPVSYLAPTAATEPQPTAGSSRRRSIVPRRSSVTPGPVIDRDVQVTVFRPSAASRREWHPLPVFVHRARMTHEVATRAAALIGPSADRYVALGQDSRADVRRGCRVTVEAWLDGATCDPESVTFRWREPSHEALFRFRYDGAADVVRGGVRVFADQLLIADVGLAIEIGTGGGPERGSTPIEAMTAARHERIFASYSHKDRKVVRYLATAARALGDDFIIDADVLRSGEDWQARLDELIGRADAFQLFWSSHSMRSPQVQREWTVALSLGREDFVRPVYWQDPRPEARPRLPPPELDRLHFSKLDLPRQGLLSALGARLGRRG